MNIKCIITDDEPIARQGLRGYIEKISFLTIIGECEDAIELNNMLKTTQPDLLFIDIEMPHISGLELLSSLKNPPKVIIVSAYEHYALKGYELDVVDYLLKPVSFDRFVKSADRAYDLFMQERKDPDDAFIFVKSDKVYKRIFLKDILFLESMENYVVIHLRESKEVIYSTLKQIQGVLPNKDFLHVHRSYVVNINHIEAIEGNGLIIGKHRIPIARNLREEIYSVLLSNHLITPK